MIASLNFTDAKIVKLIRDIGPERLRRASEIKEKAAGDWQTPAA